MFIATETVHLPAVKIKAGTYACALHIGKLFPAKTEWVAGSTVRTVDIKCAFCRK